MKLSYAQYMKSPEITCLGSWCLLHGPEQHLKREALARMRQEAAGGEQAGSLPYQEGLSWEVLEGPEVSARELLNRCQTGALFGGARVIVVEEAERMEPREQEMLAKGVGPLPPGVAVMLVTGEGAERRQAAAVRGALRRAIEQKGVAVECEALKVREATAWAIARAKQAGKRLEPAAARKLVEQKIGARLGEIEAEIEKLSLFVGEREAIGTSDVDEVTPRLLEEDIFRLLDAVGRRSGGHAVSMLRGLLQEGREQPLRVLAMLAQAIRLIWQTKLLVERGWRPGGEVDKETALLLPADERKNALVQFGRRPWLAGQTARQANAFSWHELRRAMQALRSCDLAIKGIRGKISDPALALELLVVQLCTDLEMPVWEAR